MSSRVHFAVELSQAIRPSREMARSSVECILIMVNSCNAQPCRRECELFASGSEMYPVQKYHFHRANSFPTRDRNHATGEQFLEITILQITTLSTCISPIWKCITNNNTTQQYPLSNSAAKFLQREITKNRSISATNATIVVYSLVPFINSRSINSLLAQKPIDGTNSKRILLFIAVQSPGERVKFSHLPRLPLSCVSTAHIRFYSACRMFRQISFALF